MNTDDMAFGGSGYPTGTDINCCVDAVDEPYNGKPYHLKLNIPPLAGIYFTKVADPVKKPVKKATAKKTEKKATKKVEAKVEAKAKSEPKTTKVTKKPVAKKSVKTSGKDKK